MTGDAQALTRADLEKIERELARVIRALLDYCDGVMVYKPCRCGGLPYPHRPGCRGCKTDPEVAKTLNRWRDRARRRNQVTCYCGAYSFPHRCGGGLCNRTPDDPVTRKQARGERAK